MKKLLFLVFITLSSCESYDKFSKDEFLYSRDFKNGLFNENFRVANYGVGGDVYSLYLTDSIYFRKHLMVYFDNEYVEFDFNGNEMTVSRMYEKKTPKGDSSSVLIEQLNINIEELIKNKNQD